MGAIYVVHTKASKAVCQIELSGPFLSTGLSLCFDGTIDSPLSNAPKSLVGWTFFMME